MASSDESTNSTPAITIGIANYRGGSKLQNLLNSIRRQETRTPYEVIVVDDGSPPHEQAEANKDTFQILRDIPHAFIIVYNNCGCVATYNTIFDYAVLSGSPIVALIDNDVVLPSNWLATAHLLYSIIPDVGVLSWKSIKTYGHRTVDNAGSGEPLLQPTTELAGYCFVLSVDLWKQVGHFDEKFRNYQADSDMCARLWKQGRRSYRVNYPVVGHEEHATLGVYTNETQANIPADMAYFQKKWGMSSAELNRSFLAQAGLLAS